MINTKIKLLIAVPSLECGGLERNVSIICNNINTDKFDVTLTILDNSRQFFSITNPSIKIIDLKISSVRKSLFAIAKISRTIRPDIILTTANHLNLFFGIFKWLFPRRIKIIGRESSIVSLNKPTNWSEKFYRWLLHNFYKKLDLIVCQSGYMQNDLIKTCNLPLKMTRIINNAVQPPLHNNFNGSANTIHFITVARLSAEKGLDRIIRALSYLDLPFKYTIIGEGELRPMLEKLIEEQSMAGKIFLPGKSAEPFMQVEHPTLFLMGSYFEGFPNVLLEANSAGIPVVAFNAPGGIAEVITNNENGMLVNGDDDIEFAAAIKRALDYPFNRNKISSDIQDRFNVKKIVLQWELMLEETCLSK